MKLYDSYVLALFWGKPFIRVSTSPRVISDAIAYLYYRRSVLLTGQFLLVHVDFSFKHDIVLSSWHGIRRAYEEIPPIVGVLSGTCPAI